MTTENMQQAIHARHTIRHLAETLDRIHIERVTGPDTLRAAARYHLEALNRLIGELEQYTRWPSTTTSNAPKMLAELVELVTFPPDVLEAIYPPETSIDPLDGFTLGYDRGYIGIGLHCATCTDQTGDIGMSDSEAIAEIDDGTPLADVIELARTHHQRHTETTT